MERTDRTHHLTQEAAETDAERSRAFGWSAEVASEPDPGGWPITAHFSDDEGDGLWAVSRTKAFRLIRASVADWLRSAPSRA